MKKVLALVMCVLFAVFVSVPAFAMEIPTNSKNVNPSHHKECKVCKEKGKANCEKHKNATESKKECEHSKKCEVCKEKGKANCEKHKNCCESKKECKHSKNCKVCKEKGKANCPDHKNCCKHKKDKDEANKK